MTVSAEINRRAYWIALILAPFATGLACLLISLLGTPIVMLLIKLDVPEVIISILSLPVIPLWALIFGLPFYGALGGPLYWVLLGRGYRHPILFAGAGLAVNLGSPILCQLVGMGVEFSLFVLLFGSLVAPLWSVVFAVLYNRRTRHELRRCDLGHIFA